MTSEHRVPIFFSYSFDRNPPAWAHSSISDEDVANWFQTLIKAANFQIVSGKRTRARQIPDKISEEMDKAHGVIAIFTGKHRLSMNPLRLIPPIWVVSECAFKQGQLGDLENQTTVVGFRERGVLPDDLPTITSKKMEIPVFDRDDLEKDRARFMEYLREFHARLEYGPSGQPGFPSLELPFQHNSLHKILLIYRNGYCTSQSINEVTVTDKERFQLVDHHIFNYRVEFPALETMMRVPIYKRKEQPFFYGKADITGNKPLGTALRVEGIDQRGKDVYFKVGLKDEYGKPLNVKWWDRIRYQIAWGLPGVYPVTEEELEVPISAEVTPETYCLAEAEANKGRIKNFALEIRFERQSKGDEGGTLFSKNPVYRIGRHVGQKIVWGEINTLRRMPNVPRELDLWYEVYRFEKANFEGRVQVAWRPSGKKYSL